MPEMQEQFPALWPWTAGMPEMQEQFPALWPWTAGMPYMQDSGRPARARKKLDSRPQRALS